MLIRYGFVFYLMVLATGLLANNRQKAMQLNYSGVQILQANPQKAISLFQKAYHLDGTVPNYPNNAGVAFLNQKEYKKALTYFQKSTQISSSYGRGYYNQGVCHQAMRNHSEAVKAYTKALKYQQTPQTYFNLALVYGRLGNRQQTIHNYKEFLKIATPSMAKPIRDARARIKKLESTQ